MKTSLDEQTKGRTSSGLNRFWNEHGQVAKVTRIIAPIECYIWYRYFHFKKSIPTVDALIQIILLHRC